MAGKWSAPGVPHSIVNLSALAEEEPRTPGQAAFNSHVMSSQML